MRIDRCTAQYDTIINKEPIYLTYLIYLSCSSALPSVWQRSHWRCIPAVYTYLIVNAPCGLCKSVKLFFNNNVLHKVATPSLHRAEKMRAMKHLQFPLPFSPTWSTVCHGSESIRRQNLLNELNHCNLWYVFIRNKPSNVGRKVRSFIHYKVYDFCRY